MVEEKDKNKMSNPAQGLSSQLLSQQAFNGDVD